MPRYIKQRDQFRCGPIALLNILKWAGNQVSYEKHLPALEQATLCMNPQKSDFKQGTYHQDMDRALRDLAACSGNFTVRRVIRPTLAQIREQLWDGGAVLLAYRWETRTAGARHFVLVVDIKSTILDEHFLMVNQGWKQPTTFWRSTQSLKNWELRFQRTDRRNKGWFLTRTD